MSYQLGPPINDIGHSPNPTPEQYSAPTQERYPTGVQEHYPIAIQEHYPSPIQDYHQPPASSPTPDYTSMPSDRQEDSRSATIASQNASHGREHGMYGADETVVDLHAPVQEKKHDADANNTPAAARTTGAEELGVPTAGPVETRGAEIKLSQKRKWFLLLVFSVAQVCIVYDGWFTPFYLSIVVVSRRRKLLGSLRLHGGGLD